MWFKQVQLYQLTDSLRQTPDEIAKKLEPLEFRPCFPSMPCSIGWVSPVDEEGAPLVRAINGHMMLCLQVEEKILPAAVIQQEVSEKIKLIEVTEARKVYQKEKLRIKDEAVITLLPRAFSKFTRIYGYIDTKNQWLVLNTANEKKQEQFISLFKKSITEKVHPFELKKLSPILTYWLKNQNNPSTFSIEKACVLQDPAEQKRVIRCQHQDLFSSSIQSLIKDGCEIKQLALTWADRVHFVIVDHFSIQSIRYLDDILTQVKEMEAETKQQQFDADFLIMTDMLSGLCQDLLKEFLDVPTLKTINTTNMNIASVEA